MCIKNPFALLGADADKKIYSALENLGFSPIALPSYERLPMPIRSHADTLLFVDGKNVFCSDDYAKNIPDIIERLKLYGYTVKLSSAQLSNTYPRDIAFNCFKCQGVLYGNMKHIANEIREYGKANELCEKSVKQGYSKCSTVVLESALITADVGIAARGRESGLEVLLIESAPDAISLSGYSHGFIGGTCGIFKNNVFFTGDINSHPSGDAIVRFCEKQGYSVFSLLPERLVDIGGIMFFEPLN